VAIAPGDRVRLLRRSDPRVRALGDYVVSVVGIHPSLPYVVKVQGPSGAKCWVRDDDLYKIKGVAI